MFSFKNLFKLFDEDQKIKIYFLFFLMIINSLLETLTIGLVIPLINLYFNTSGIVQESFIINKIEEFTNLDTNFILNYFLTFFLIVYILKTVFVVFISWYENKFIVKFKENLSNRFYRNYVNFDISIFTKRNSAEFLRNTITEIDQSTAYLNQLLKFVLEVIIVFAIFILLLIVNYSISTVVLLGFLITSILYLKFFKTKLTRWGEQRLIATGERIKFLQEGLGALKEIKLSGTEKFFYDKFKSSNKNLSDVSFKINFLNTLPRGVFELFAVLTLILIFLILQFFEFDFSKSITIIGVYLAAAFRIMPSFSRIVSSLQSIRYNHPSINVLIKEIDYFKKDFNYTKQKEEINFKDKIEIRIKNFDYGNSRKFSLSDINLEIKKGDKIGLIGSSGSGKTTLIEIFLGILKPNAGDIKIDGKSIFNEKLSHRKVIGYIPQNIFILDDTLIANILFGQNQNDFDIKKIDRIIELVNLKNLVKRLPNGLSTRIGERGIDLSGGEVQRIGIARALINDPEILLFDEATSALDTFTEKNILSELELIKDKTFISVAHRIGTLKNCKRIYKLENGIIVDQGGYEKFA